MASFTGTLRKNDLEGGFWELACDGGEVYRLQGKVSGSAGGRVKVVGEIESGGFGIQMSGPAIKVQSLSPA